MNDYFVIFAADLVDPSAQTIDLNPINRFFVAPVLNLFEYSTSLDGLDEDEECLLFVLSINETELDPRDVGQVDLSNNVALLRIIDEEFGKLYYIVRMMVQ